MLRISYPSPSILISKGPSLLREKPLSAWSNCMEEQPASNRTASMLPGLMFMLDSRASSSLNRPSNGFTRPLEKGFGKQKSTNYSYANAFGIQKIYIIPPPQDNAEALYKTNCKKRLWKYKNNSIRADANYIHLFSQLNVVFRYAADLIHFPNQLVPFSVMVATGLKQNLPGPPVSSSFWEIPSPSRLDWPQRKNKQLQRVYHFSCFFSPPTVSIHTFKIQIKKSKEDPATVNLQHNLQLITFCLL